jgi:carbonic anhydrase/acetyltransferase-like protein (isoleucine patch superfamily)
VTSIDPRAEIGADTIVHPFTVIQGAARIGARCTIGPHAVVGPGVAVSDWVGSKIFRGRSGGGRLDRQSIGSEYQRQKTRDCQQHDERHPKPECYQRAPDDRANG